MISRVAEQHYIRRARQFLDRIKWKCIECGHECSPNSHFCSVCGFDGMQDLAAQFDRDMVYVERRSAKEVAELESRADNLFLADAGVYIMYLEPYYKIGQSDSVRSRLHKLQCGAPLLELIHVIETRDMNWCEEFLHDRFRAKRVKREWFNLDIEDIMWLFNIWELDPPENEVAQHALLDLL